MGRCVCPVGARAYVPRVKSVRPTISSRTPVFRHPSVRLQRLRRVREEGEVNVVRSIWASVQGDPVFMRRINGWLTCFWIVMIPISVATGWLHSVTYVSALSLWSLVSGHWSTWQAARVEVTQQREEAEREQNPIEQKVVDALVAQTDVSTTN